MLKTRTSAVAVVVLVAVVEHVVVHKVAELVVALAAAVVLVESRRSYNTELPRRANSTLLFRLTTPLRSQLRLVNRIDSTSCIQKWKFRF